MDEKGNIYQPDHPDINYGVDEAGNIVHDTPDGKPIPKSDELRIIQKKTGPTTWERTRIPLLQPGDIFRMFEPTGLPVHGGAHFRAKNVPYVNNDGEYAVDIDVLKKVKVGRNAPCPCESGKKYKKCCIGKETIIR